MFILITILNQPEIPENNKSTINDNNRNRQLFNQSSSTVASYNENYYYLQLTLSTGHKGT